MPRQLYARNGHVFELYPQFPNTKIVADDKHTFLLDLVTYDLTGKQPTTYNVYEIINGEATGKCLICIHDARTFVYLGAVTGEYFIEDSWYDLTYEEGETVMEVFSRFYSWFIKYRVY